MSDPAKADHGGGSKGGGVAKIAVIALVIYVLISSGIISMMAYQVNEFLFTVRRHLQAILAIAILVLIFKGLKSKGGGDKH